MYSVFFSLITLLFLLSCKEKNEEKLDACIEVASDSVLIDAAVEFRNCTLGGSFFLWDFGDGSNSSQEHAINTFIFLGIFDVELTVKSGDNRISDVETVSMFVGQKTVKNIRIAEIPPFDENGLPWDDDLAIDLFFEFESEQMQKFTTFLFENQPIDSLPFTFDLSKSNFQLGYQDYTLRIWDEDINEGAGKNKLMKSFTFSSTLKSTLSTILTENGSAGSWKVLIEWYPT